MYQAAVSSIALLLISGIAQANTTRYFSSSECQEYSPDENGALIRGDGGCQVYYASNVPPVCGRTAAVILPISGNLSSTVDFDNIYADYTDGRGNTGSTQAYVDCYVSVVDSSGMNYASSTLTSSNGAGQFQWGGGGGTLPNSGSSISNVRRQHFVCHVPSAYYHNGVSCVPDNGSSLLRAYWTDTVNP